MHHCLDARQARSMRHRVASSPLASAHPRSRAASDGTPHAPLVVRTQLATAGHALPRQGRAGQGGAACRLRRLRPGGRLMPPPCRHSRGASASRSVQPGRPRCRGCGFMCCCTRLAWPPASIARATDGITQIAAGSTAADRADLVADSRPIVRMAGSIERHAALGLGRRIGVRVASAIWPAGVGQCIDCSAGRRHARRLR